MNALNLVNELLSRFSLKEISSFGAAGTDSNIALRKINLAIQIICAEHPFKFLHKTSTGSLTAVTGTSLYNLASDVKQLIAVKHTYGDGGWLQIVNRQTLETYRPDRSDTSTYDIPTHICLFGKTQSGSNWLWQVEIWPAPSSSFNGQTISYYYTIIPTDLALTTDVPIVPDDFHWVILEVAETLWRRGPLRVGDLNQIDLYTAADNNAKKGIYKMIKEDSVNGFEEMAWEENRPEI